MFKRSYFRVFPHLKLLSRPLSPRIVDEMYSRRLKIKMKKNVAPPFWSAPASLFIPDLKIKKGFRRPLPFKLSKNKNKNSARTLNFSSRNVA